MSSVQAAVRDEGAKIRALPVPEPDLTPDELLRRARALRPLLRATQDESDARGHYSEEIHKKFMEAGFYRIIQPKLFGGYEFDYTTYYRVMLEIATGHPGAGWCLALGASHGAVVAAHWPAEAQVDFFGTDGHFIAPHSAPPGGRLTKVEGGYLVSGKWGYCSGIPYSTHLLGTSLLQKEDGPAEMKVVVLPREAYTIVDDWGGDATLGMAASGSNSVTADNVFVPEHHVSYGNALWCRPEEMADGTYGTRLHGNPMYLGRLMGPYHASLITPVIGAARAAIDAFEEILTSRVNMAQPNVLRAYHYEGQRPFGEAVAMTDAAEAILIAACDRYMEYCYRWGRDGAPITLEENLRLWTMEQQAGKLAAEAVELIWRSASSAESKRGTRIQRYFRDVAMYRQHISAQIQNFAVYLARAHFDQPVGMFGL
jgi:3-hydroxy-9,10-secoandrosta-1,3,5(10)-triene-9,17-dione monooxygenase